ncbi:hypothetical protein [Desulfurivibrio sp. C05AmB]|uniref:hypothetical protein n=1 Tax=Desulfurivibrio sp. C05AmB TaxID=3374371 RepID=UPI00376F3557
MPLEFGVWRIDGGLKPVDFSPLDIESRLEDILDANIGIASPNWLVIGRQVRTDHGLFIDMLAIDGDANLVVLELKRDKTYRDIIAQVLDYGSWVRDLTDDRIAQIFDEYQKRWHKDHALISIDEAFKKKFGISMPDEMNSSHELVVVAANLDASTERIVRYLADEYGVRINAVFFQVFQDDGREYLGRAWLRDPAEVTAGLSEVIKTGEWNGEYYVSFGYDHEVVRDGLKRGYLVAGGGLWYSKTLEMLKPGDRIWVNVPGSGYVGVGEVTQEMQPVDKFMVAGEGGKNLPIATVSSAAASLRPSTDDPDKTDYLVGVNWLKTVDPKQAIREKGFFGNQNSVARPRSLKWDHTVERLKTRFGIR